jgi:hypothetical protein
MRSSRRGMALLLLLDGGYGDATAGLAVVDAALMTA